MYNGFSLPFWLASQPVAQSAVALIGAGVLISLLGHYIVNQYFTVAELEPNNVVGGVKYSFIAEVYAVTVALCLVGSWEIYQNARDTVQREAASMYFLLQAVPVYSEPGQEGARQAMEFGVRNYAKAVVEKDWDNMRLGRTVSSSDPEFNLLVRAYLDVEPKSGAQQALQARFDAGGDSVNEPGPDHARRSIRQSPRSRRGRVVPAARVLPGERRRPSARDAGSHAGGCGWRVSASSS